MHTLILGINAHGTYLSTERTCLWLVNYAEVCLLFTAVLTGAGVKGLSTGSSNL